jgi:GNAT superfamily N-acetyltransferase
MASSHLALRVLTATELWGDAVLVPTCTLINESYKERESKGLLDRYTSAEDFARDLDADGLCAVIQDSRHENRPVAVAVAKRWKGRRKDDDDYDCATAPDAGTRDWEIGPVASHSLPEYRGRGLIERCLQGLSALLVAQVTEGPVRLWVKVVEEFYAAYWARKGFVQCGASYVIPVGEWHRDRAYTLVDMVKEISRSADGAGNAGSRLEKTGSGIIEPRVSELAK